MDALIAEKDNRDRRVLEAEYAYCSSQDTGIEEVIDRQLLLAAVSTMFNSLGLLEKCVWALYLSGGYRKVYEITQHHGGGPYSVMQIIRTARLPSRLFRLKFDTDLSIRTNSHYRYERDFDELHPICRYIFSMCIEGLTFTEIVAKLDLVDAVQENTIITTSSHTKLKKYFSDQVISPVDIMPKQNTHSEDEMREHYKIILSLWEHPK